MSVVLTAKALVQDPFKGACDDDLYSGMKGRDEGPQAGPMPIHEFRVILAPNANRRELMWLLYGFMGKQWPLQFSIGRCQHRVDSPDFSYDAREFKFIDFGYRMDLGGANDFKEFVKNDEKKLYGLGVLSVMHHSIIGKKHRIIDRVAPAPLTP